LATDAAQEGKSISDEIEGLNLAFATELVEMIGIPEKVLYTILDEYGASSKEYRIRQ